MPALNGAAKANAVVALRRTLAASDRKSQITEVNLLLADPNEDVRFLAMKWAGEEGFTELASDVAAAAVRQPNSVRLSRAALEAGQLLARANPSHPDHGKSGMTLKPTLPTEVLERVVFDESAPAEFRAQALAMLPVESARKHTVKLPVWASKAGSPMQGTAIWSLGFAGGHYAAKALEAIIAQDNLDAELRADAIIARAMASVHAVAFAEPWINAGPTTLRHAARFVSGKSREGEAATRPAATADWQKAVATSGDVRRGRRLFFSPQLGCAKCHVAEGRGAIVGPDLSAVGRSTSRARLIESIVEPSREVAIDFQGYEIETKSGETFTGLQAKSKPDGEVSMLGFDGRKIAVEAKDIGSFRMLKTSLMPDGLVEAMSVEDFRDLLAYLENLK